jgi:hypothetical protein
LSRYVWHNAVFGLGGSSRPRYSNFDARHDRTSAG